MQRRKFFKAVLGVFAGLGVGAHVAPAAAQSNESPSHAPVEQGGKKIVVSLAQQRVYAYSGNALVMSMYASVRGCRRGNFRILNKIPMAYSSVLGWRLPNWMGIYGGRLQNGFHGASIHKSGARDMTSLGCIVMRPADAVRLYAWTPVGTLVSVR